MIKQVLYYEFPIIILNNYSISINALLIVSIALICLFLRHRFILAKYLLYSIYILIIVSLTNILNFSIQDQPLINNRVGSQISYFNYNILFYFNSSITTFFMAYSIFYIIVFSFFYPIFRSFKYFIFTIIIIQIIYIIEYILGLATHSIDGYKIYLMIIGYVIGYLLTKFDKKKQVSDNLF